jgi:hypothetical protein
MQSCLKLYSDLIEEINLENDSEQIVKYMNEDNIKIMGLAVNINLKDFIFNINLPKNIEYFTLSGVNFNVANNSDYYNNNVNYINYNNPDFSFTFKDLNRYKDHSCNNNIKCVFEYIKNATEKNIKKLENISEYHTTTDYNYKFISLTKKVCKYLCDEFEKNNNLTLSCFSSSTPCAASARFSFSTFSSTTIISGTIRALWRSVSSGRVTITLTLSSGITVSGTSVSRSAITWRSATHTHASHHSTRSSRASQAHASHYSTGRCRPSSFSSF